MSLTPFETVPASADPSAAHIRRVRTACGRFLLTAANAQWVIGANTATAGHGEWVVWLEETGLEASLYPSRSAAASALGTTLLSHTLMNAKLPTQPAADTTISATAAPEQP